MAMPQDIEHALDVLQSAQRPLVLIGQGMASSRAEEEVRAFIERTQIPFVRTPKGKGVLPDDHPLSAGAARSLALLGLLMFVAEYGPLFWAEKYVPSGIASVLEATLPLITMAIEIPTAALRNW